MQPAVLTLLHHILPAAQAGNCFLYAVCSTPSGRTWSASTSSSTSCGKSRTSRRTSCCGSPRRWMTTKTGRSTSTTWSKYEQYCNRSSSSAESTRPGVLNQLFSSGFYWLKPIRATKSQIHFICMWALIINVAFKVPLWWKSIYFKNSEQQLDCCAGKDQIWA